MSTLLLVASSIAAALLAAALTGMVWAVTKRRGLLDLPNPRSSHKNPTPRGGGLAIVIVVLLFLGIGSAWNWFSSRDALAIAAGGAAVALIGFIDDRCGLPWWLRILVHASAVGGVVAYLGPCSVLGCTGSVQTLAAGVFLVLAGVWGLNLFNFMDGIDSVAGAEAIFIAVAAALLVFAAHGPSPAVLLLAVVAGAAAGFLLWNLPPARIFMGDVGSGFLGFLLFALPLLASARHGLSLWTWGILWGAFVVDASVTLLRRLARRERLYEAHRSHAYQWLARRWHSHGRVTLGFCAVDLLWLFPLAWLSAQRHEKAALILICAYTPLVVTALVAGAGRLETPSRRQPPG